MESDHSRSAVAEAEERKLIKFSNYSLCVTLPKSVIRRLNWQKGDIVRLVVDENKGEILIRKGLRIPKEKEILKTTKTQSRVKPLAKKSAKARW